MDKFEYLTVEHEFTWRGNKKINDFQAKLNTLGSEGWELVNSLSINMGIYGATSSIVSVFKRKISEGK